ncbi:MAG: hypothetical protein AB7I41_08620 [Candidatus Sericytochromatia bacterium]
MNFENKKPLVQLPVAESLVAETLADLNNHHPLVSKLALQRFASQLRRLRSDEMDALKASLIGRRASSDISHREQEALTKMFSLVETALENRRLRMPRMTQPLNEALIAHFPVVGRGIGEAIGE